MNVKIPSLIHIGGQDINIEIVDNIEGDNLGQCSVSEGYIKIARSCLGRKQGDSSQLNTFWHEVVHTILDTMQENELSANEKFVGVFSSMLCEVLNSFEYGHDETSGDREK